LPLTSPANKLGGDAMPAALCINKMPHNSHRSLIARFRTMLVRVKQE